MKRAMADGHALNRAGYDAIADDWATARTALRGCEPACLEALLAGLPPGAAILDLGCGNGAPIGAAVLARGHRLTGVDQSAAQLARARAGRPDATWVQAPIESFADAGPWAGIICWDALFHLERRWHAELLARWAAWLAPGGRLMLTVGGSDHPPFTDTMFGHRFFYDSLPPAAVEALLRSLGLRLLLAEFTDRPDGGRDKGRYALVAERAAP